MEKEPKYQASAYMSVEDYEAALEASVENDENGNPIPNFSAVKGALSIQHKDGSWTFKEPQEEIGGDNTDKNEVINNFLEQLAKGMNKGKG